MKLYKIRGYFCLPYPWRLARSVGCLQALWLPRDVQWWLHDEGQSLQCSRRPRRLTIPLLPRGILPRLRCCREHRTLRECAVSKNRKNYCFNPLSREEGALAHFYVVMLLVISISFFRKGRTAIAFVFSFFSHNSFIFFVSVIKFYTTYPRGHDESARLLFRTDVNINIDTLLISISSRFPVTYFTFFAISLFLWDFCFNISFFYYIRDQ